MRLAALMEVLNVTLTQLPRSVRSSLPDLSTVVGRSNAKQQHPNLYRRMCKNACWFVERVDQLRSAAGGGNDLIGGMNVPPTARWRMEIVARDMRDKPTAIYKILKDRGIDGKTFRNYINTKYPLPWREICADVGLGWLGKEGDAPPNILTRARMRKTAEILVRGRTLTYAAEQMGLKGYRPLSAKKRMYPRYWEYLYNEAREEEGLLEGHRLGVKVVDMRIGRVVQRMPYGMSSAALRKQRDEADIKPLRRGTKGGPAPGVKDRVSRSMVSSPSGRVRLFDLHEKPTIDGKEFPTLTAAQYKVIWVLIEAKETGLSKYQLERKSRRAGARKVLRQLCKKEPAWAGVISFAGTAGKGYRIK